MVGVDSRYVRYKEGLIHDQICARRGISSSPLPGMEYGQSIIQQRDQMLAMGTNSMLL